MKICIVASQGGHLTEAFQLIDAFQEYEIFLITHHEKYTEDLEEIYNIKTYLIKDLLVQASLRFRYLKIIGNFLLIFIKEFIILLKERPKVVISTGAEIAIPISYMVKLYGGKLIFVESLCRVYELSKTGKIIYPIADLFLVQWPYLTEKYDKALYRGKVL